MRYNSQEDLQMRLFDSVIRYKGQPVRVIRCRPDLTVELEDIVTHKVFNAISSNSPDLDISSPPIGFINGQFGGLWHLARMPRRRQKQGISVENTVTTKYSSESGEFQQARPFGFDFYEPLGRCILNDFPTYQQTLDVCKQEIRGQAFSRKLALSSFKKKGQDTPIIRLHYIGETIGLYSESLKGFILGDDYNNSFFVSMLLEHGVQVL